MFNVIETNTKIDLTEAYDLARNSYLEIIADIVKELPGIDGTKIAIQFCDMSFFSPEFKGSVTYPDADGTIILSVFVRRLLISVDGDQTLFMRGLVSILAHELRHCWQLQSTDFAYHHEFISLETLDLEYMKRPEEIDAYAFEKDYMKRHYGYLNKFKYQVRQFIINFKHGYAAGKAARLNATKN